MKKPIATAITLVIAGTFLAGTAQAAFQIKKDQPSVSEATTVFDQSEYSVWVDNTYLALHEYGKHGYTESAPSYGDPMPLADALKILVPQSWKVLRAKNLEQDGQLLVSWDMKDATWIDVLSNLGQRHGMQFHVDHNRNEVFIKDGRRLVFDRPVDYGMEEQYPRAGTQRVGQSSQTTISSNADVRASTTSISPMSSREIKPSTDSAFTIYTGDSAEAVMRDLALIFGYETTHWLIDPQTVNETITFTGNKTQIMAEVAKGFGGRICLYDTDMNAAIVPKTMECPQ
ncbi:hypothetical protein [Marinobacter sp. ELB17]|uniref:hypothetical protein n=1 Tax=Marinobacter sp. ELB17 TaxID=270374 RepID=UPI0000F38225|nr:hypothetical protein [Marinobacter sp. ELB17]EAZ98160.1 hypothetical protein MELB17_09758 [Marinobacter sp. ELB17]